MQNLPKRASQWENMFQNMQHETGWCRRQIRENPVKQKKKKKWTFLSEYAQYLKLDLKLDLYEHVNSRQTCFVTTGCEKESGHGEALPKKRRQKIF